MRAYIDASVFLHLLFDGSRADEAERILSSVEEGESLGYVSPLVVEETVFKLLVGRASELGVDSFYEFRKRYAVDEEFRRTCYRPVEEFISYLDSLRGLRWVEVGGGDVHEALRLSADYGLLPADALHAALALRLGVAVATFDSDFRRVPGLKVIP